jgi:Glyoxalase/Bleomycin resistance protein/Dioxygenase superfamily
VCGQQKALASEGLVFRPLVGNPGLLIASCRRITRKTDESGGSMRIKLASIMVDHQDKALKFYTEIFGFVKKHDIPVGGGLR